MKLSHEYSLLTSALLLSQVNAWAPSWISPLNANNDCMWVVKSWQKMGQTTDVNPSFNTGCCTMDGVTCEGSTVTEIDWRLKGLTGSIPEELKSLENLALLYFFKFNIKCSWWKSIVWICSSLVWRHEKPFLAVRRFEFKFKYSLNKSIDWIYSCRDWRIDKHSMAVKFKDLT